MATVAANAAAWSVRPKVRHAPEPPERVSGRKPCHFFRDVARGPTRDLNHVERRESRPAPPRRGARRRETRDASPSVVRPRARRLTLLLPFPRSRQTAPQQIAPRSGAALRRASRPSPPSRRVRAFGNEPSEYGQGRGASYDEVFGLDEDENARLAAKRNGSGDGSRGSANFRAKTGKIGDVLERGGDGTDYGGETASINNDVPIEGTVVEDGKDASAPNNVVDGGLNLEASILAGAVDASYVDASQGAPRGAPKPPPAVSMGDQTMDDLYAEIANKNNIGDGDDFGTGTSGPGPAGPTPPPVAERVVVDQHGNPVPPAAPEPPLPADAPPASEAYSEVEVMPEVGDTVPDAAQGAVQVKRGPSAMDELMMELDSSMYDDDLTVETVQLIKVQFRIEKAVEFGEVLRMVGGHESMGSWSLRASPALKWSEGDVWVSDELELPVDGVFVYKYVVTDASDAGKPVAWQKGNNQVLTLLASDAPALIAQDDWSGDPSKAYTMRPNGEGKMQAETRLVQRLGDADAALHESRMEVMDLKVEVKTAQLQSAALREEARLSSNVRLKLKQQLAAEKKRSEVLEEQVFEWKQKFKQLTAGTTPTPHASEEEEKKA